MDAWGRSQGVKNVRLLPDGSGVFSRALGMLVSKDDLGFGDRSWRYAMVVRDGVIEKMFIEPEKPGDPFEVSDADTVLDYLAPGHVRAEPATLFTREGCPHCQRARTLLEGAGIRFEEIALGNGVSTDTLAAVAGQTSTPQIFIGGQHVGGADDLAAYLTERAA